MSRSRKKHAIYKGSGSGWVKSAKGFANRRVRRNKKEIPDGNWYRKMYSQWDIHDFVYHMDFKPRIICHFDGTFEWIYPDPKWKIYMK